MSFTRSFRQDIPANSEVSLDMGPLARMPRRGRLQVYAVMEAAVGTLEMTVLLGTDVILDRSPLNVAAAADRVVIPDDLVADGDGEANDPITIRVTNVTATATFLNARVAVS